MLGFGWMASLAWAVPLEMVVVANGGPLPLRVEAVQGQLDCPSCGNPVPAGRAVALPAFPAGIAEVRFSVPDGSGCRFVHDLRDDGGIALQTYCDTGYALLTDEDDGVRFVWLLERPEAANAVRPEGLPACDDTQWAKLAACEALECLEDRGPFGWGSISIRSNGETCRYEVASPISTRTCNIPMGDVAAYAEAATPRPPGETVAFSLDTPYARADADGTCTERRPAAPARYSVGFWLNGRTDEITVTRAEEAPVRLLQGEGLVAVLPSGHHTKAAVVTACGTTLTTGTRSGSTGFVVTHDEEGCDVERASASKQSKGSHGWGFVFR